MLFLHTVLRTKIIPPPRGSRTLARPRVSQILSQAFDYRLTILEAGRVTARVRRWRSSQRRLGPLSGIK